MVVSVPVCVSRASLCVWWIGQSFITNWIKVKCDKERVERVDEHWSGLIKVSSDDDMHERVTSPVRDMLIRAYAERKCILTGSKRSEIRSTTPTLFDKSELRWIVCTEEWLYLYLLLTGAYTERKWSSKEGMRNDGTYCQPIPEKSVKSRRWSWLQVSL